MWHALETKARFIGQIMKGDASVRSADDVYGQELSFAEVKAIASGNPAILTLAEADAEINRLSVLRRNHADQQFLARRQVRELPGSIERQSRFLNSLRTDQATIDANAAAPVEVGGRKCLNDEVANALAARLGRLPTQPMTVTRCPLGVFRGLTFGLILYPGFAPEAYLEGLTTQQSLLASESRGPRAILNAVERLAGGYGARVEKVRESCRSSRGSFTTTSCGSARSSPQRSIGENS